MDNGRTVWHKRDVRRARTAAQGVGVVALIFTMWMAGNKASTHVHSGHAVCCGARQPHASERRGSVPGHPEWRVRACRPRHDPLHPPKGCILDVTMVVLWLAGSSTPSSARPVV